jgi:hypothetical protein
VSEQQNGSSSRRVDDGPPHGVTLESYARVTAWMAEGDRPAAALLEAEGLTEKAWMEATQYWLSQMGADALARGVEAQLALAFSEEFGRAQDALKGVPDLTAEDWATLIVEIQQTAKPAPALAVRGLSQADFSRLVRHWAKRLASDPEQNVRFMKAYESLQPEAEP